MEKSGVSTQESGLGKVKNTISKINSVINTVGTWLFRLRKPVMAVLLLFLCFPLLAAIPMLLAAFVGSRLPLPRWASGSEADPEDAS